MAGAHWFYGSNGPGINESTMMTAPVTVWHVTVDYDHIKRVTPDL